MTSPNVKVIIQVAADLVESVLEVLGLRPVDVVICGELPDNAPHHQDHGSWTVTIIIIIMISSDTIMIIIIIISSAMLTSWFSLLAP